MIYTHLIIKSYKAKVFRSVQHFSSKKISKPLIYKGLLKKIIMPATGIEPVREYKSRRILSPVRLPVPPRRHPQLGNRVTAGSIRTYALLPAPSYN